MSTTMAPRRARSVQLEASRWTIIDGDSSNVGGGLWKRIDSEADARQADAAARLAYLRSRSSSSPWTPDSDAEIADDRATTEASKAAQLRTLAD